MQLIIVSYGVGRKHELIGVVESFGISSAFIDGVGHRPFYRRAGDRRYARTARLRTSLETELTISIIDHPFVAKYGDNLSFHR